MDDQDQPFLHSRRDFGKLALGSVSAATIGGLVAADGPRAQTPAGTPSAKPNSLINGVQVGLIIPYSFGSDGGDAANLLWHCVALGISAVELQSEPAEAFAGLITGGAPPARGGGPGGFGAGRGRAAASAPAPSTSAPAPSPTGGAPAPSTPTTPTSATTAPAPAAGPGRAAAPPDPRAAELAAAAEIRRQRLLLPMDRYKALRQLYNDAGVRIYAFKLGLTMGMTDEEYDYAFQVAATLGANHLTMELPTDVKLLKRIGAFAEKNNVYAAYHTHAQGSMTAFDDAFAASKANMSNIDVGHYVGATSESPIPFFLKFHDRIASFHMKDKTKGSNPSGGDQNKPWGQGETPLKELLQLVRKNKWTMPATIELEYPVPEGSTRAREITKCLEYCRAALELRS